MLGIQCLHKALLFTPSCEQSSTHLLYIFTIHTLHNCHTQHNRYSITADRGHHLLAARQETDMASYLSKRSCGRAPMGQPPSNIGSSRSCNGKQPFLKDTTSSVRLSRLESLLARVRSLELGLGRRRRRTRSTQTVHSRESVSPMGHTAHFSLLNIRISSLTRIHKILRCAKY